MTSMDVFVTQPSCSRVTKIERRYRTTQLILLWFLFVSALLRLGPYLRPGLLPHLPFGLRPRLLAHLALGLRPGLLPYLSLGLRPRLLPHLGPGLLPRLLPHLGPGLAGRLLQHLPRWLRL